MTRGWALLVGLAWTASGLAAAAADPVSLLNQVREVSLSVDEARSVSNLSFVAGHAEIILEKGTLFPASAIGGRIYEIVFVGQATILLEPPDTIEAAQLEMFTGAATLRRKVTDAVMVLGDDRTIEKLLAQPLAEAVVPAVGQRASELFAEWKTATERKRLDVDAAILFHALDALDPSAQASLFTGRFTSPELGPFLISVSPDEAEPFQVGQFVRPDTSDRQERKRSRWLHRQQRRGRLIGLDSDDLGIWDTWLAARLIDEDGKSHAGRSGFEIESYRLDVSIDDEGKSIEGRAWLTLQAVAGDQRVVRLKMHRDLQIDSITDEQGREIFRVLGNGGGYALLPAARAAGDKLTLEIAYHGVIIDRLRNKLLRLRETIYWYPHAGDVDLATYDVTLRWPAKFDLLASGRRVDEGKGKKGRRWERRTLDVPGFGFSFELGDYDIERVASGDIPIRVAFNRLSAEKPEAVREEVITTIVDVMDYYQEIFGKFPAGELTVVTSPRSYSQGLLGYVTLSDQIMEDFEEWAELLGIVDRRMVVAHELAHQWWGNLVGWQSYRDQWISEAMAQYAAWIWADNRLEPADRPTIGPTTNWANTLGEPTERGHAVEAVGPLVLGERLSSSLAENGYSAIVYKKGAVVINMLNFHFGEESFVKILGQLVQVASGMQLTTEDFLQVLGSLSGENLTWFARRYIYGTGIPEIYYRYEFEELGEGNWRVHGSTEQLRPYRFKYAVIPFGDGRFDLVRSTVELQPDPAALSVPVQIAVYDPSKKGKKGKKATANSTMMGRLRIDNERFEFDFEIPMQPFELWFDRDDAVLGYFWAETKEPKRMLYYRGYDNAAAGKYDEAEGLLRRALETAVVAEPGKNRGVFLAEAESDRLDARTHLVLGWLLLDRGKHDEARQSIRFLRNLPAAGLGWQFKQPADLLQARLDLQRGEYAKVIKALRKEFDEGRVGAAGHTLLAIATHMTGDEEAYREIAREAKLLGCDLGALEPD